MSLEERLADWRQRLVDSHAADGLVPPTEEEVLGQFLYSAISHCFETEGIMEAWDHWDEPPGNFDNVLNAWVDQFAQGR